MICVLDDKNKIINIVNSDIITMHNERPFFQWNQLWEQYTDIEPFDYAKNRYIHAAGAEFVQRRDEVRWIEIAGVTYGFDCAPNNITNFMAAYMSLMVEKGGATDYKVWLGKDKKALVKFEYEGMKKVYDTVRSSQLAAYACYEDIKSKLLAVSEAEGKEKLEEIFPLENS